MPVMSRYCMNNCVAVLMKYLQPQGIGQLTVCTGHNHLLVMSVNRSTTQDFSQKCLHHGVTLVGLLKGFQQCAQGFVLALHKFDWVGLSSAIDTTGDQA